MSENQKFKEDLKEYIGDRIKELRDEMPCSEIEWERNSARQDEIEEILSWMERRDKDTFDKGGVVTGECLALSRPQEVICPVGYLVNAGYPTIEAETKGGAVEEMKIIKRGNQKEYWENFDKNILGI